MYDSLSIEEAREIVLTEKNKNQKNERRLLFIGFNSINILAQNTLLKILEEPPLRTSFILFVSSPDILLSTICSRCIILTLAGDEKDEKSFLETPYKERLEWVKTLLENKALIGHFFYSLEREIEMFIKKGKISRTEVKALQIPLQYKHMLLNLTPTSKYLLEEIALTLPLIKER